jgi:DAK2 domain fusion protein YloV
MRESAGIPINLFKEKRRLLDVAYLLQEILSLAKESLSKTPEMLSVLKDAGVVDAGAQGFVFILEAMSNSLNGRNPKLLKKILPKKIQGGMESAKEHLVYKFCVECVVEGKNSKLNQIRNKLNDYGKSLIMAKSNGLLKVHLHTNHPQKLLQYCSSLGKLVHSNTKNMEKQQETFLSSSGNINKRKKIGIVVSTIGQGLSKIFKSMGADVVIVGKKTINPSLRDLTKAIKRLKAKNIIVLPNDSNVLPIAKEAVKMFNNTYIIPSQTIPQGISALLAFSEEASLTNNRQNMNKALKKVKSGILTQSLKNGKDNQIKFKKNDILGFYEGHLKSVGKNFYKVALNLINNMIKEDDTIISLFYGKKVNQEEAKKLLKMIRSQHSHVETELYYGGQPNYPFIISID